MDDLQNKFKTFKNRGNKMFKRGAFLALTLMSGLLINATITPAVQAATNAITQLVPFQGRLHNSAGDVVQDGVYDLTFYIYETATGGEFVWSENHTQVSVIHGYVNVLLGGTQNGGFAEKNVDFATQKYLSIAIDAGQEMFPRHQLVPTFHSYNASKLGGIDAADYTTDVELGAAVKVVDDRVTSIVTTNFEVNGTTIKNATNATNAVNATNSVNATTASNSLKLGDVTASNYARTDIHETFASNVTVNGDAYIYGEDLHVGNNSGGDTEIHFYDDNSNDQRTIQWDDSLNTFRFEDNNGGFYPLLQTRSGTTSVTDAAVTISFTAFPNAIIWAGAYGTNTGKYAIAPTSFANGYLTIDRNNDFGTANPIKWFAIGY